MSQTTVIISLVLCWCFAQSLLVTAIYSSETQHRTKAASEKQHDLWCHRCDSMTEGDKCLNLSANHTYLHQKCSKEQKKCLVRRISISTSTEEVTGKPKLWLLQRNCTETCESGCIIIGERTKLHSCITCCDEHNFCNAGNAANRRIFQGTFLLLFFYIVFFYVLYKPYQLIVLLKKHAICN